MDRRQRLVCARLPACAVRKLINPADAPADYRKYPSPSIRGTGNERMASLRKQRLQTEFAILFDGRDRVPDGGLVCYS